MPAIGAARAADEAADSNVHVLDAEQDLTACAAGETVDITTGEHTKNSAYLDTLTVDEAGTYYLGGDINGNYIFKVEVTTGGGTVGAHALG